MLSVQMALITVRIILREFMEVRHARGVVPDHHEPAHATAALAKLGGARRDATAAGRDRTTAVCQCQRRAVRGVSIRRGGALAFRA
jgi:hypothetical protein